MRKLCKWGTLVSVSGCAAFLGMSVAGVELPLWFRLALLAAVLVALTLVAAVCLCSDDPPRSVRYRDRG